MKTKDFSFELPEELIAQYPTDRREDARLLVVDRSTQTLTHSFVRDLPSHVPGDSVIVFNDSKVRKARLHAAPLEGGPPVEFLLLRPEPGFRVWEAMVRRAKRQKPGKRYRFPGAVTGEIAAAADGAVRIVAFDRPVDDTYLETHGAMPLPPYIKRESETADDERYQTVYAKAYGSVAAPTAGLHFTEELLDRLKEMGHTIATVTLHVGLGTFSPVRTESIEDHEMHTEEYEIDDETSATLTAAKQDGKRILAVGTTSVRTLESAAVESGGKTVIPAVRSSTGIFIYPPYTFRAVDCLFTNFHTPESTLLMLVGAFAGLDLIKRAYAEAVRQRYRFFSYGDAMLII